MERARTLDQFYTRTDIARDCVRLLTDFVGGRAQDHVWVEPSAGAGAFVDFLPQPRIALDIEPGRGDISEADFLSWNPGNLTRDAIVVGNPPFGKNASLARKFFNRAAEFAEIIAFIVPRTFQKESLVKTLDRRMHLRLEQELKPQSFVYEGLPYDVPTVFQIWQRSANLREVPKRKLTHPDFEFVAPDIAHFAFQRVGARAGLVSHEGLHKSPQSHYFLRSSIEPELLFDRLDSIDWTPIKTRTAGNPSIAKRELIASYESLAA